MRLTYAQLAEHWDHKTNRLFNDPGVQIFPLADGTIRVRGDKSGFFVLQPVDILQIDDGVAKKIIMPNTPWQRWRAKQHIRFSEVSILDDYFPDDVQVSQGIEIYSRTYNVFCVTKNEVRLADKDKDNDDLYIYPKGTIGIIVKQREEFYNDANPVKITWDMNALSKRKKTFFETLQNIDPQYLSVFDVV